MTTPADTVRDQARQAELDLVAIYATDSRLARHQLVQHIREAHEAGATLRQIGQAAGLSFQRIHQIVKGAP